MKLVACPPGQERDSDTHDHCCWPSQAWSTPKHHCVGTPSCPHGMVARGEDCAVIPVEGVPIPQPVLKLALDKKAYKPGATILVRFTTAVPSAEGNKSWITAVASGAASSAYGEWVFVDDGASTAALKAPDAPGNYELRLHTQYPAKTTNPVFSAPFSVGVDQIASDATPASAQFTLAKTSFHAGEHIDVRFGGPLVAQGSDKFWITIIDHAAADSSYGEWSYVTAGARSTTLTAPAKAGDYEIRLHANYPTKPYNVVHRQLVHVSE